MGISKAQASALADSFLDGLGSDKEGFQPRESLSEMVLLAGELIEDAQGNLNRTNTNASGKLSSSLEASEPEQEGSVIKVDVWMEFYGKFVNKGVKGTKSGRGLYKFKHDKPSRKMVDAILDWQRTGKAKTSNTSSKSTSRNERKNRSISAIDSAYAIARSILQKGIKPTGFLDKAVASARGKVRDRLGAALRIDVINTITNP